MMPSTEAEILSRLSSELSAEGYDVYVHPQATLLPPFLGNYRPDLVAMGRDKNLVVEVASRGASADAKLGSLSSLFAGREDWEFRVIWLEEAGDRAQLEPQDAETIRRKLDELRELARSGHGAPAIIYGWSVFEAIGRALSPRHFAKPQTPARLVSTLAEGGDLSPSEADRLREIGRLRNLLVHGALSESVAQADVDEFIDILDGLQKRLASVFA